MLRKTISVFVLLTASLFGVVLTSAPSSSAPLPRSHVIMGTWGGAIEVPGTSQLNTAGQGAVDTASCSSDGNCSGAGTYKDAFNHQQVFVVDQINGTWGTAIEVPGIGALNTGGTAYVFEISCVSSGNCSAGGVYTEATTATQAFVVSEVNGTWGTAIETPGTPFLNAGGSASVFAMSCASAGNCSSGGYYVDTSGHAQAFVDDQSNGSWSTATAIPGLATLNAGGSATIFEVSCPSAGNCSAGGNYTDAANLQQSFVVDEVNGVWGNAQEVPGSQSLNPGGSSTINSLRCWSVGNCSAVGEYTDAANHLQALVVSEVAGVWGTASEAPGTAALNAGGNATLFTVSCSSAGNCNAGGHYTDAANHLQALVITETANTWGSAIEIPGTAALNVGGTADVNAVSCSSSGNCIVGGFYSDTANSTQAFVDELVNGTWGTAIEAPGTASLNATGNASALTVWCTSQGNCGAAGLYRDATGLYQAYVDSETFTKGSTSLHATVVPVEHVKKGKATLSLVRFSAKGLPSDASGTVAFRVNGVLWCSAQVSGGGAHCNSGRKIGKGHHSASATYSGDDAYTSSTSSARFTVR